MMVINNPSQINAVIQELWKGKGCNSIDCVELKYQQPFQETESRTASFSHDSRLTSLSHHETVTSRACVLMEAGIESVFLSLSMAITSLTPLRATHGTMQPGNCHVERHRSSSMLCSSLSFSPLKEGRRVQVFSPSLRRGPRRQGVQLR